MAFAPLADVLVPGGVDHFAILRLRLVSPFIADRAWLSELRCRWQRLRFTLQLQVGKLEFRRSWRDLDALIANLIGNDVVLHPRSPLTDRLGLLLEQMDSFASLLYSKKINSRT